MTGHDRAVELLDEVIETWMDNYVTHYAGCETRHAGCLAHAIRALITEPVRIDRDEDGRLDDLTATGLIHIEHMGAGDYHVGIHGHGEPLSLTARTVTLEDG